MSSRRSPLALALPLVLALVAAPLAAQSVSDAVGAVLDRDRPDFLRFTKGERVSALETCVRTYATEDDEIQISLVAAVHVADADYYAGLKKVLAESDLVLFEGVRMDEGDEEDEILTLVDRLQRQMGRALGLSHQREALPTTGERFRRADLGSAAIKAELAKREIELIPGAGVLKILGPFVGSALKMLEPEEGEEPSPFKQKVRDRLKLSLAKALGDGDALYDALKTGDGRLRDEVIVGLRNAAAMKELDVVLKEGKAKRIAILYGAAHMPDFDERLRARFSGLRVSSESWRRAWRIGPPEPAAKPKAAKDAAEEKPAAPTEKKPDPSPRKKL
ncbi:MAG: hypothetical protein R3F20_03910 [Planctomycetota bacterium]